MLSTLSGKSTSYKFGKPENEEAPIEVTPIGIITEVIPIASLNALLPIDVTPDGMFTAPLQLEL